MDVTTRSPVRWASTSVAGHGPALPPVWHQRGTGGALWRTSRPAPVPHGGGAGYREAMSNEFADAHRAAAATFTDRVNGVTDWDAPSPVDGWTARSVVEHLIWWFPAMLAAGSDVVLPEGPDPKADLVGAWEHQRDAVQALLEDPATLEKTYSSEHIGEMPLPVMIQNFYTADVFMHTWDLARATGQDDRLDSTTAEAMLAGMEPIEEMLRGSGQFGTDRGPLPADADATDRLISFIGRDPRWVSG